MTLANVIEELKDKHPDHQLVFERMDKMLTECKQCKEFHDYMKSYTREFQIEMLLNPLLLNIQSVAHGIAIGYYLKERQLEVAELEKL